MTWDETKSNAVDPDSPESYEMISPGDWNDMVTDQKSRLGSDATTADISESAGSYYSAIPITETALIFTEEYDAGSGASITVDWNNAQKQFITLTTNTTVTFTAPDGVGNFQLRIVQDSTGSKTLTLPTIKFPGGTTPTWSTSADSEDILSLFYNGSDYYGTSGLDFS